MIIITKMPARVPTYYMNDPKLNRHKPGKIDSNMRVPKLHFTRSCEIVKA